MLITFVKKMHYVGWDLVIKEVTIIIYRYVWKKMKTWCKLEGFKSIHSNTGIIKNNQHSIMTIHSFHNSSYFIHTFPPFNQTDIGWQLGKMIRVIRIVGKTIPLNIISDKYKS